MKTRLSIGIDCDGVVSAFVPAFRRLSVEMFGLPSEDKGPNTDYDFKDWGLTPFQVEAVFKRIGQTKNWWETLGKMPGTTLLEEAASNYRIYFITHRSDSWAYGRPVEVQSANWIASNYNITPSVIVSDQKGLVARGLELFAFIDDKPQKCEQVWHDAPTCRHTTYIRDSSYNQLEGRFIRVPTLNSFLQRLP